MGGVTAFKKAWVRAKEAGESAFSFGGREHDTATGEPRKEAKLDMKATTAVKNVRSLKSKLEDAEASAVGTLR